MIRSDAHSLCKQSAALRALIATSGGWSVWADMCWCWYQVKGGATTTCTAISNLDSSLTQQWGTSGRWPNVGLLELLIIKWKMLTNCLRAPSAHLTSPHRADKSHGRNDKRSALTDLSWCFAAERGTPSVWRSLCDLDCQYWRWFPARLGQGRQSEF